MLEVRDLTLHYGDVRALDGVDLTIADNETVAVLGPSGSGKTTLLRAIAGLETPLRGSITRDGTDLAHVPAHKRGMGLMFQEHALFPHRDVLANVMFGLRMQRVSRRASDSTARDMLERVGLAGFEHRPVSELSGGEQQRVALARALAPAPALLMLDEPLGALDRVLREQLVDELRALFTRLDPAVLFVTHDHDEAFALGDRVALMRAGRIEQVGPPEEVWRRPATEFAARFLGWNVIGQWPGGPGPADAAGHVAIRSDGLRIAPTGALRGVVAQRAFRRGRFLVRVVLDGTGERVEVDAPETPDTPPIPAVGTTVHLEVDAEQALVFPREPPA
jgi:thiamine transport system ATP-binding protein